MPVPIKKVFPIFFLLMSMFSLAQEHTVELTWHTDYRQALEMAKSENKKLLIYFTGSDWSIPCKMLNDDFFYTEKFKDIAVKHLILLRVNSPRRDNMLSDFHQNAVAQLRIKYKQKVFPTVIITDTEGKMLGKVESYNYLHDTSNHYAMIKRVLRL